ncbi:MAG: hypothetical protein K2X93_06250 [Candidatus Obscuribacterales bacterium]|nr:hypothetical protein [Candidatus Obscuribacterales bacterium]
MSIETRTRKSVVSLTSALTLCVSFVSFELIDCFSASPCHAQGKKKSGKPQISQPVSSGLSSPEINSYLIRLREKLDSNWTLADGQNKVTLSARIDADGQASEISATSTPSCPEAEQSANEAFAKVQPLEALPKSAGTAVKLTIIFDSFADPHGDTNRNLTTTLDPVAAAPKESQ